MLLLEKTLLKKELLILTLQMKQAFVKVDSIEIMANIQ